MTTRLIGTTELAYSYDIEESVIDRMMDPAWQGHMYTFESRQEAINWLVWQLSRDFNLSEIDGFVDLSDDLARLTP